MDTHKRYVINYHWPLPEFFNRVNIHTHTPPSSSSHHPDHLHYIQGHFSLILLASLDHSVGDKLVPDLELWEEGVGGVVLHEAGEALV